MYACDVYVQRLDAEADCEEVRQRILCAGALQGTIRLVISHE